MTHRARMKHDHPIEAQSPRPVRDAAGTLYPHSLPAACQVSAFLPRQSAATAGPLSRFPLFYPSHFNLRKPLKGTQRDRKGHKRTYGKKFYLLESPAKSGPNIFAYLACFAVQILCKRRVPKDQSRLVKVNAVKSICPTPIINPIGAVPSTVSTSSMPSTGQTQSRLVKPNGYKLIYRAKTNTEKPLKSPQKNAEVKVNQGKLSQFKAQKIILEIAVAYPAILSP